MCVSKYSQMIIALKTLQTRVELISWKI